MILTIWYLMMVTLLWSVFYRTAIADKTTLFRVRLGLTGTAAGALVGMGAPLYGWAPDYVTLVIVLTLVNMQASFAKFWQHTVPSQYIKPEFRPASRRRTDLVH